MYVSSRVLLNIFWLSVALLFFHIVALKFYFYWMYPWYDIPMHVVGGILIGRIILFSVHYFGKIPNERFKRRNVLAISLFGVLTIGVLWEVFERKVGITSNGLPDTIDTIKDVLDDVIGALIVSWYFVLKYKK